MPPMPENSRSGNACVICDTFASDCGRIAGPPSPPLETQPVDVHLELERVRIDQRDRRKRIRRGDRVGAAEKRRARLGDDVGR